VNENEEIRFYDGDYYKWIPDGEYSAVCTGYTTPMPYFGGRKVYLHFMVLTEPYRGTMLFMAFNVAFKGVRPASKYFKYWCLANGDRQPSRNALMSARIFKDKRFSIKTRTAIPKRAGEDMPFDFRYSVVDSLKAIEMPDKEQEAFD
jgi:hypothetical protein